MRSSTLARGGALLAAVAVGLTLGGGPAAASDSHDTTAKAKAVTTPFNGRAQANTATRTHKPTARAMGADALTAWMPTDITEFKQKNIAMYEAGEYIWDGFMAFSGLSDGSVGSVDYMFSHLYVGGTDRGAFEFGYSNPPYTYGPGLVVPSTIATGKARLGPTEISYVNDDTTAYANNVDNTHSNYFYIRRGTGSTAEYGLVVHRGSKSISFHAYNWLIFKPSTGLPVPMNTIKLQYRKDHQWVTLKTIDLNFEGSGSYIKTAGTPHNYRLYYPTTDTIYGSYTEGTGNI